MEVGHFPLPDIRLTPFSDRFLYPHKILFFFHAAAEMDSSLPSPFFARRL